MFRLQLFFLTAVLNFSIISFLCLFFDLPLIYYPIDYGLKGFQNFGILIASLSFLFIYVQIPWLRWFWNLFTIKKNPKWYYVIFNLLILQFITIIFGLMESYEPGSKELDFFYLYKGVSNSCIYILSGNISLVIISILFAKEEYRKMQKKKPRFGEVT